MGLKSEIEKHLRGRETGIIHLHEEGDKQEMQRVIDGWGYKNTGETGVTALHSGGQAEVFVNMEPDGDEQVVFVYPGASEHVKGAVRQ